MGWIRRDGNSKITRWTRWPMEGGEEIPDNHPEVVAFLTRPGPPDPLQEIKKAVRDLGNGDATAAKAL